jgi:hypothetical protein
MLTAVYMCRPYLFSLFTCRSFWNNYSQECSTNGPQHKSHWKLTCSRHDIAENITELALSHNHSLTHLKQIVLELNKCWLLYNLPITVWNTEFTPSFSRVRVAQSIFIVLLHRNNSPRINMSPHSDTLSRFRANQFFLFLPNAAYWAEKQQIPIL